MGGGLLAALRRRDSRRSASVRTLGNRRADRDALARRRSTACCASSIAPTRCRRRSTASSTTECVRSNRRSRACRAIAIRSAPTKMRGRPWRAARNALQARELALRQLAWRAEERAAAERCRGRTPARSGDAQRFSRIRARSTARNCRPTKRSPGSNAASATAATRSTARRSTSPSFCARRSSRARPASC